MALRDKMVAAKESLFERNIHVLQLELEGVIAHANGYDRNAIEKLQAAAAIESTTPKHPVTPGPTLPSEEMLGHLYLLRHEGALAKAAFERSLALYPNRLASRRGLAAAQALPQR